MLFAWFTSFQSECACCLNYCSFYFEQVEDQNPLDCGLDVAKGLMIHKFTKNIV